MVDEEPSLNIPSLLTLAVVSFFVIRWFFNRDSEPGSGGSGGGGRSRARGNAVDPAQVEQISQMFPQLNTREIMWDLQRNGGSVAATTERILSGRGLEVVSFLSFLLSPRDRKRQATNNGFFFFSPRRHSSLRFPSLLPRRSLQQRTPHRHPVVYPSQRDRT